MVRLRSDPDHVICEVRDDGTRTSAAAPPFPGHLPPDPVAASGHGMWVVRQLSDLATETFGLGGSVVRLCFSRSAAL